MTKQRASARPAVREPTGLWHQPTLLNLIADVLFAFASVVLAWGLLATFQRLPLFPLREVVLSAAPQHVSAGLIAHAVRTSAHGNFFTVDLVKVREGLEALPWVRHATVRRQWPDGLVVTLEEHQAVAQWRHLNGESALVNRQGELFDAELPEDVPALPLLSGPAEMSGELLSRLAAFDSRLASVGRHVSALTLSPRRAWRLRLDDGVTLELGRDEERHPLDERLTRFVAHYASVKTRFGNIRGFDMRYPNGFALIPGGQPALQAGKQS